MNSTPQARTRRGWTLAIGLTAVFTAAPAPTSAVSPATQTHPAQVTDDARLELVEQRFATDPNGVIRLRYHLAGLDGDPLELIPQPATVPTTVPTAPITDPMSPPDTATPLPPEPPPPEPVALTFEVINYPPLSDADDVERLVGSDVDPDAFRTIAGDAIDGVAFDARPLLTRNDDGTVDVTLDIGTDVIDSVETRLKMERPGIYPLRVQLLLGDHNIIATAGTVVQRLAGAGDADIEVAPPIDLAVVTLTPSPLPRTDEGAIDAALTRLDEAIDLAAQLDTSVTLEVPPMLIAEEAATTAGSERLATSLAGDELIAMPLLPLDVSSAVAAGRGDAYTRLVRAGEDVLTEAVPTAPSRRDVWITTDPLSAGGAQHLRDLGTRFVVIGAELYAETISHERPPTDRFVVAELPDGATLPFLVVDSLSEQLAPAAADRILTASTSIEWGVATLAEMLVEQADEDATAAASADRPTAPPRRSRVLTAPDFSTPDARLLQALTQLVTTTPSVRFTPASTLTGVTDVALDDGEPITVQLPDVAGPSLAARIELIDATAQELAERDVDAATRRSPPSSMVGRTRQPDLHRLHRRGSRSGNRRAAGRSRRLEASGRVARAVHLHADGSPRHDRDPHRQHSRRAPRRDRRARRVEDHLSRWRPTRDAPTARRDQRDHPGRSRIQRDIVDQPRGVDPGRRGTRRAGHLDSAGHGVDRPRTSADGRTRVGAADLVVHTLAQPTTCGAVRRRPRTSPQHGQSRVRIPVTDSMNPTADDPTPTVHVVTDSSCDLPASIADELGISIVPLTIRFDDEEFVDREELSTAEFWTRCVNSDTLPETAAPAPGQFEQTYRSAAAKGATGIIVVSLSSALSATMQSAQLAARTINDDPSIDLDVRVIDSRTISMGLGTIAVACARAARGGVGLDDIEALAHDLVERTRVFGALDTLENLKKGGRIGNAKALLATALSIKPIIEVTGGVVEQAGKQRTRSKALAHLVSTVQSHQGNIENLAVLHADCSDIDLFVEMLAPYHTDDILVGEIGPVIGTHGGRGTIGVAFQVTGS